jgi:hypothetical protein
MTITEGCFSCRQSWCRFSIEVHVYDSIIEGIPANADPLLPLYSVVFNAAIYHIEPVVNW